MSSEFDLIDFQAEVIEASYSRPVVVDFWADWCDPCKWLEPIITELAAERKEQWAFIKINSDHEQDIAAKYNIKGIPAIRVFQKGEIVASYNGMMWKKDLDKWIDEAISGAAR